MMLSSGMTGHPSVASGPVAQWSEQATHNRSVGGSIPPGPTCAVRAVASVDGERRDHALFEVAALVADDIAEQRVAPTRQRERRGARAARAERFELADHRVGRDLVLV